MKEANLISSYILYNKLNIEQVMQDFTPYIYKIILNKKIKISDEDIEEIISDVFLALWKNQDKLDINKEMSSYLAGITKNIFNNKIRNIKNINYIDDYKENLYDLKNIEIEIEETEKSEIIMNEINAMKSEDKTIFKSYYYNSKSMKEIANNLNITEKKVKSRLFRIRRKVKKSLEKRGYSYNG